MRVIHVMASSEVGGGAKYLELLLPELRTLSIDNIVVTSPGGPMVDSLRALGFHVDTPIDMMKRRFSPRSAFMLRRLVDGYKPDIVHFHGTRAAFQGMLISRRHQTIYTSHGAAHLPQQNRIRKALMLGVERQNALRVGRYTGVSKRDILATLGREKPEAYVPNPVDPRFLVNQPVVFDGLIQERKPLRIGTVARPVPQKGLETLRDAVALLSDKYRIELQIVGAGPLLANLRRRAATRGVSCAFLGELSDPLPALKGFDIFVIPSRWEGQPLSLLEAMAAGIPAVLSDCPGLKELSDELELNYVFPVDDADALARTIVSLVSTPSAALATYVNRLVAMMTRRNPASTAQIWKDIYRNQVTC